MRSALTLYFTSLLRSYLLSPAMYAGLIVFAGFFSLIGAVGAYGGKIPLPVWFSIMYLMFNFAIMGGLSRSIVVGSGALSYLIRHAGINPIKLTLVLTVANMISQIVFSPLFLALTVLTYYITDKVTLTVNFGLLISAIVLTSLFMTTLGIAFGLLMVGKATTAKIANFIPLLPMILYFTSLLTPPDISSYNPITAIMILLTSSLKYEGPTYFIPIPPTLSLPVLTAVILTSSAVLLLLSTLLMKRIREVNIYDAAIGF